MATIRLKNEYRKWEKKYKVDSRYFKQFFNEDAIQELERFDL